MPEWNKMLTENSFCKRKIYKKLLNNRQDVSWKKLFYNNEARPRAGFTLWMACLDRLATKSRLRKFGMLDNDRCVMCAESEDLNHLFFMCTKPRSIWQEILRWLHEDHVPSMWECELQWMVNRCKSKSWKSVLLKTAFAETIHACWLYRNSLIFKNEDKDSGTHRNIARDIIDRIVQRVWNKTSLRGKIVPFLL
ncbi:uncharacterized protein LOC131650232 [Vicia villosa]|uniref:uncharacterized protein LOC131650232 n=1 Tax=Vicia villosa TaxID=3911 RepID=UPI00273AE7EE|nr:uncharacterized protein LOC131650232 [Vicia villosa]